MTAGTPFPAISRRTLLAEPAGGPRPGDAGNQRLASPAAAGQLHHRTAVLSTWIGTVPVRIAGILSGTPAGPRRRQLRGGPGLGDQPPGGAAAERQC